MDVVIEWRVKDTLLAYMQRDPGFSVTLEDGARFDPEQGVALPARVEPDGTVVATGSVVLSAHGGALALTLREVVIDGEALWISDPLEDPGPEQGRFRLLTLVRDDDAPGERYQTLLAPEADILFLYNYVPGTPFGELVLRPVDESDAADERISRS